MRELELQEIPFEVYKAVILNYKSTEIDTVLKADIIVDSCVVVEIKSGKELLPIHEAQLLTHMKLLHEHSF